MCLNRVSLHYLQPKLIDKFLGLLVPLSLFYIVPYISFRVAEFLIAFDNERIKWLYSVFSSRFNLWSFFHSYGRVFIYV